MTTIKFLTIIFQKINAIFQQHFQKRQGSHTFHEVGVLAQHFGFKSG